MEAPQVEAMETTTSTNNPPEDDSQDNIIDTWYIVLLFSFDFTNFDYVNSNYHLIPVVHASTIAQRLCLTTCSVASVRFIDRRSII